MTVNNYPVSVTYSNSELRNLIEEYITQQKNAITLKGACSYILYWAVEDSKVDSAGAKPIESNELQSSDQERIKSVLEAIVADGRIAIMPGCGTKYTIITR